MNRSYYCLNDRCRCDCNGQGRVILVRCIGCGQIIGTCSELDFVVAKITGESVSWTFNRDRPYDCLVCGSSVLNSTVYAAHDELPKWLHDKVRLQTF